MIKYAITSAFILISIFVHSQVLELDTHKRKLVDFLQLEEKMGSVRVENKSNFISGNGVAQPVQFMRKEKGIPDLLVYYFYFQHDSSIYYILYEWDESNFKDYQENTKISSPEINAFIDRYKALYGQVSKTFGEGKSEGSITDMSKIETGDFDKQDIWNPNDSTKIDLSITLSSKYEKKGAMSINPTYRIRLYTTNLTKSKNEIGLEKLDENKVKQLDTVLQAFMSALKNNEIDKARSGLILLP